MALGAVLGTLFGLCLWCAPPALANDFDDFQRARQAYEQNNFEQAATRFRKLVGPEVPRLQDRSLVLESLKYLGASYLFLGKPDQAYQQFERLLRLDLTYVLDPLAFPEEVQSAFRRVKQRLEADALNRARAEAERRDRRLAEQQRLRQRSAERTAQLLTLAKTERVVERHSRWTALLPFGVGQFQNGHDGLGLVLAVSQVSLLAASVTTFLLHDSLRGSSPEDVQSAIFAERAYRYTNRVSFGLFVVAAVGGIIDAQLRYRPSRRYERQRDLPAHLLEPPSTEVSVGLTGLRVAF